MGLKVHNQGTNVICDVVVSQAKKAGHLLCAGGRTLCVKYAELCDKGSKKIGAPFAGINRQTAEKVAAGALKVLPIALCFFLLTPTLSLTSLVLAAAVSSTAVLLDPKHLSYSGKVKVVEGAALGIAMQTTLSIIRALVTISPIGALSNLIVGSAAVSFTLYASRAIKP